MDSNFYDIIKRVLTVELAWTSLQIFLFVFLIIAARDFIASIIAVIKFKYSTIVSVGTEIHYNTGIDFIRGVIVSATRNRVRIDANDKIIYVDTQKFMSGDWVLDNEKNMSKNQTQNR